MEEIIKQAENADHRFVDPFPPESRPVSSWPSWLLVPDVNIIPCRSRAWDSHSTRFFVVMPFRFTHPPQRWFVELRPVLKWYWHIKVKKLLLGLIVQARGITLFFPCSASRSRAEQALNF